MRCLFTRAASCSLNRQANKWLSPVPQESVSRPKPEERPASSHGNLPRTRIAATVPHAKPDPFPLIETIQHSPVDTACTGTVHLVHMRRHGDGAHRCLGRTTCDGEISDGQAAT